MTRKPFSKAELEEKLKVQRNFIESSIAAFDSGNKFESLRMAVAVRVLFHNTRNSHALLAQLSQIESLQLPNTGKSLPPYSHKRFHDGSGGTISTGLGFRLCYVCPAVDSGLIEFHPNIDEVNDASTCSFDEWWETPVLQALGKTLFGPPRKATRKHVVLGLANKEGGAHVDPNPSFEWWYTTRAGAFGNTTRTENRTTWSVPLSELALGGSPNGQIVTPVHATMRTIAEEVLVVLHKL
jgi:hypothetical protein